jgi:hypothetical protein
MHVLREAHMSDIRRSIILNPEPKTRAAQLALLNPDRIVGEIQKLIQIVVIPLYRWIGLAVFVCERKKARASEQYRASERKQCRQEHIPTSPTSAASFPFAPCALTSNGFPIPPFIFGKRSPSPGGSREPIVRLAGTGCR